MGAEGSKSSHAREGDGEIAVDLTVVSEKRSSKRFSSKRFSMTMREKEKVKKVPSFEEFSSSREVREARSRSRSSESIVTRTSYSNLPQKIPNANVLTVPPPRLRPASAMTLYNHSTFIADPTPTPVPTPNGNANSGNNNTNFPTLKSIPPARPPRGVTSRPSPQLTTSSSPVITVPSISPQTITPAQPPSVPTLGFSRQLVFQNLELNGASSPSSTHDPSQSTNPSPQSNQSIASASTSDTVEASALSTLPPPPTTTSSTTTTTTTTTTSANVQQQPSTPTIYLSPTKSRLSSSTSSFFSTDRLPPKLASSNSENCVGSIGNHRNNHLNNDKNNNNNSNGTITRTTSATNPNKFRPLPIPVRKPLPNPEPTLPSFQNLPSTPSIVSSWSYSLGEVLGSGTFSEVIAGTHKASGKKVAIKVIDKGLLKQISQNTEIDLHAEVNIIKTLKHPNIMQYYDHIETEEKIYIAFELLAGGELLYQVAQYGTKGHESPNEIEELERKGNYSEMDARTIMLQIMNALSYLHKNGIVHRDLKPENIMFTSKDPLASIKLIDFGIATRFNPSSPLQDMCGTPDFCAPEIIKRESYDFSVDIWASGTILYILLCGQPPFKGRNTMALYSQICKGELQFPQEQWREVSEDAQDLVKKMLCPDPRQRITADQILEHKWMLEGVPSATRDGKRLGGFLGELRRYNSLRFFKATEKTLLKSQRFSVFKPLPKESEPSSIPSPNINYRRY